jgi:integrase
MTKRRTYGDGGIDARGENCWRLRYRVNGKRFTKSFRGTKSDGLKELRRLLRSGDTGEHVAPDKMTLRQWVEHWISIGAPGNKQRLEVGRRTVERYAELLRCHVMPMLGDRPLQQLQSSEIDALYVHLADKISARSAHHVHSVLGACLGAAARTRKLVRNPMLELAKVPSPGEADHGMALDEEQLLALVRGFKGSALYSIVATAAFTGARRNEILALRWEDLDEANKTLRIAGAVEETDAYGLRLKEPKTERGKRTITINDDLLALLLAQRERHLRITTGVADGVRVDLSLVKLPAGALMFPNPPASGQSFSFTKLRNPRNTTKEFVRKPLG